MGNPGFPTPPARGLRPPKPSQGPGPGCAGLRPASAEGWGNPVSPSPSSEGPCSRELPMRLAPHPDGMKTGCSWEGAALPHPPAGGGMGKPDFPLPCVRASPSGGQGCGKSRFPYPPSQEGCAPRLRTKSRGRPVPCSARCGCRAPGGYPRPGCSHRSQSPPR